jgi:serine/threonine protein kinase/Tol biopolymer transport system component
MNDRWQQIEELYHSALEKDAEARATFLMEACAGDEALQREVESLLFHDDQNKSFLKGPAIEAAAKTMGRKISGTLVGSQVGPYQIVAHLGTGGMGVVYRAHDSKLGRDIAIKTLPGEFARDPDRLARFRREARMLASLNHPNIAAIYDLEESGEVVCLVLELIEGETVRGPLPIEKALEYAGQVAQALEAAHDKGIIHRDLKPANVKVTSDDRVKVLDFGLAKAIWSADDRDLSQLTTAVTGLETVAGNIVGTPGYMSPEQAQGKEVDKRTDIWAFGCLLYELLAGKRAFQENTVPETIAAVLEHEPEWKALPRGTPSNIRELLRRCLEKDTGRRLDNIGDARATIEQAQRGTKYWLAVAAVALATLVIGATLWMRRPARPPDRSQWVQLTKLPDSVTQPALSPDGKMVAFIRGDVRFIGPGEIYVKMLPDGQPVQLTHDGAEKMSPVFSPDGARIAYTTLDPVEFTWDTWVVPTLGGQPQRWLRNASGLVWTGPQRVLFSEIKKGIHMGIVAAEESRIGAHDVYLPTEERAMAHRSYMSPDGKWVLLVEMDKDHHWVPCRVVPTDGSSPGRQVGPSGAACTSGAWSPDGRWMYYNSLAGGLYHIWRQRFPDGQPEQITSGTTEEEGIAMSPDGRSVVTAVGIQSNSIWVHNARGDRQISLEGNSSNPKFTPDGKRLCYQIQQEAPTEFQYNTGLTNVVWVADLESGRSEPLVPGIQALDYDLSQDGQQMVLEVHDREGKAQLWLAPFDRQAAPRPIPNAEGRRPRFGPLGEIFFVGTSGYVYRIHPDGTGMRKALEQPVLMLEAVSPDGQWIIVWSTLPDRGTAANLAFPLHGGKPLLIAGRIRWEWSAGGRFLTLEEGQITKGHTYIIPLPPGQALPRIPVGGFHFEQEIARLPGARKIEAMGVVPGPSSDVYAFYRNTTQRNLYRIPIP